MATKKASGETQLKSRAKASTTDSLEGAVKIPTAMLPRELYADVVRLSAYNKVKKCGPSNDSAILRTALETLLKYVGFDIETLDILEAPKPAYAKKLKAIHQVSELDGGVRKTFSIKEHDYDTLEAFASYNKMHGLLPKNVSQVCRDALAYYLSTIEYEFRPK